MIPGEGLKREWEGRGLALLVVEEVMIPGEEDRAKHKIRAAAW